MLKGIQNLHNHKDFTNVAKALAATELQKTHQSIQRSKPTIYSVNVIIHREHHNSKLHSGQHEHKEEIEAA